jgi:hypothetical protein
MVGMLRFLSGGTIAMVIPQQLIHMRQEAIVMGWSDSPEGQPERKPMRILGSTTIFSRTANDEGESYETV